MAHREEEEKVEEKSGGVVMFKNFDVLELHPEDHQFLVLETQEADRGGQLARRISRDWRILKSSLPKTIFVRSYETRIDLMRAAIVGPRDTPYSDGLFFFDIIFPSDYPRTPPLVRFHSHGLQLNPNLYGDGHVCLSIINTWKGRDEEMWSEERSTILQVLISLQSLVLNEKPYFNEPGVGHNSSTENRSADYNNAVFTKTCKLMRYTMRTPPDDFDGLVGEHFRSRASAILRKCREKLRPRGSISYLMIYELAETMKGIGATDCEKIVDEVREEEAEKVQSMGFVKRIWYKCLEQFDELID